MADNIELSAGTGGATVASDDVGGVQFQKVKLDVGGDGASAPLSNSNPVPVSDAGGSLTVDNGGTFVTQVDGAALTALQLIDNLVLAEDAAAQSGDPGVQVLAVRASSPANTSGANGDYEPLQISAGRLWTSATVDAALPAGTNNIGDVDVLSIVPGTGATSLGKAEDAAASSGDTGVAVLSVRQDTLASATSADGDYAHLKSSATGALYVNVAEGSITARAEDAAASGGEEGLPILAVRRDSASSGVSADGDWANLSVDSSGNLRTTGGATVTEDAASAGGESMVLAGAVRRDTAASSSGTDGDYSTLNVNSAGRLYTSATVDAALPAGTNNIGDVDVLTLPAVAGGAAQDAAITGNPVPVGYRASTATPSAMSADGDVVYPWATREGALVTAGAIVDHAAFTPGTSRVHPIAFQADESSTDSVDEGDAGTPRMTLDRKVITTPYAHAAAGGATPFRNIDVDESEDDVKTSAGKLFSLHVINLANAKRYLKVYDSVAASVAVGTTVPVLEYAIPTMGDTNGAGFTVNFGDIGVQFNTGICIAATTGLGHTDTGAPGANEIVVNGTYL